MKQFLFLAFISVVMCPSCKKKEQPGAMVTYKISVTNSSNPAYTVIYSADNSTKTEGPVRTASWSSAAFIKHNGDRVTFTVDGGTGSGSFIFAIYVNDVLRISDHFENPNGPKTIAADIVL